MLEALRILEAMTNSLVEPVNERTALVIRDTAQHRAEMTPTMSATIPIPERMAGPGRAGKSSPRVQARRWKSGASRLTPGRRQVFIRDSGRQGSAGPGTVPRSFATPRGRWKSRSSCLR